MSKFLYNISKLSLRMLSTPISDYLSHYHVHRNDEKDH